MPVSERIVPLYPKVFSCHISGFLIFPFSNLSFHIDIPQESTWLYDFNQDTLKFVNDLKIGFFNFTGNFTHHGKNMYAVADALPEVCYCQNINVGIVEYNAFLDADFLGRETYDVEYGVGPRLTDHYIKGPHHTWMDVETGLPLRAWQPVNGLQVYKNWNIGPVGDLSPPRNCFGIQGKCPDTGVFDGLGLEHGMHAFALNFALRGLPGK